MMMHFLLKILVVLVGPQGLTAQNVADGVDRMTASGLLAIVDDAGGWARHLQVGETTFFTENAYRFIEVVDQRGALYLLALSDGGNGCGVIYAWLHTEDPIPRLSEEFGTCAPIVDVWSDRQTVSVSMWSVETPDQLIAFEYDGQSIRDDLLGNPEGAIRPGDDLRALQGTHPLDLFRSADWRSELSGLLGAQFDQVMPLFDLSTGFAQEGDWLVADAVQSPRHGEGRAVLALHQFDRRIVVAWHLPDGDMQIKGEPDDVVLDSIGVALAVE